MKRNNFIKTLLGLPLVFTQLSFKKGIKQNPVVEFTPEIINKYNFGLYLINVKADVFKNPDYAATVSWKLGYIHNHWRNSDGTKGSFNKYGISNFLTDGWFHPIGGNYEEICNYLNSNPYGEKFRIMTKEELFHIINHRGNSKQLFYDND